ncbi:MAG: DUF389 domain-containing protein [Bacteroidetes bacterium]|nr:DUF389 domain-containing protein [Bacteroidota bacterium]
MSFLDNFKLAAEKEDFKIVNDNIQNSIDFKGTNLWILIFAIFIASLGLNVNSTAVIIGAMLVSPLMGPIMGLGFGMAINDLALLKRSFFNYFFAGAVGLATSTVFFLLSPINDAHSEILARTSPNIYDVLIALFGGLAGILATSSKQKGNVIPGVAIATALMPPLCTAGYGLATFQFQFFFGAVYLFLINTVFIALATLVTTRFLKFPFKQMPMKEDEVRAKRIVWLVVIITVLPSIYFGYDIVQQNKFQKNANRFIENEAIFPNDYLLKKNIDTKSKTITLTYGGQIIEDAAIEKLRDKLTIYNLHKCTLEIQQGFAYLKEEKQNEQANQLTMALNEKENQLRLLQSKIDSISSQNILSQQIFKELKTQYPAVQSFSLQTATNYTDTTQQNIWIAIIHSSTKWKPTDKPKIEDWLKVRMNIEQVKTYFEE